jgi:hypothetical protein
MGKYTYENPLRVQPSIQFDTSSIVARSIARPAGVRYCRIEHVQVAAQTAIAGTTAGRVIMGTASDTDKFFSGAIGANTTGGPATDAKTVTNDVNFESTVNTRLDVGVIDLDNDGDSGAALAQIELSVVAATTATGIGVVTAVLAFW